MNISEMSPEFIDMLTDEQKAQLLKDIAEQAKNEPQPATQQEPARANGYQDEFAMPRAKARTVRENVQWQGNEFVDDGAECKGEEMETPKVSRTPRTRQAPRFRVVRCSACGKDFEKREDQIFGQYHRCHRCGGTNR